jgi:hypothetical protein
MLAWQAAAVGVIAWFVVLTPLKSFVPGMAGSLGFFPFSWADGLLVGLLATHSRRSWLVAGAAGMAFYLVEVALGVIMVAKAGAFPPRLLPLRGVVSLLATLSGCCLGGALVDYVRSRRGI